MDTSLASKAWTQLRATRWQAPGSGARKRTYQTALGQAEELFHAAATVSSASRPLLLFYGLSQAGRAISAAANEGQWVLNGHGIRCPDLRGSLPDIPITTDPSDKMSSFAWLSRLLDSPLWGKAKVRLETIWDCLPSNERVQLGGEKARATRHTPLELGDVDTLTASECISPFSLFNFPPHLALNDDARELNDYLKAFPGTQGTSFEMVNTRPLFHPHKDGWGEASVFCWELNGQSVEEQLDFLHGITRCYRGRRWFFPVPHQGAGRGMHPLMAWWAVLFTLSMLARYQPSEWEKAINVDSSEFAVPIEHVLSTALDVVPWLVSEALEQVSASPRSSTS